MRRKIMGKKQKEKEDYKINKNKEKLTVMRFIIYVCFLLEVRTHVFAKTPLEPSSEDL